MQRLTELPSLHTLEFTGCELSEGDLKVLHGARSMVDLSLHNENISEAAILAIRKANPGLNVHVGRATVNVGSGLVPQNFFPSASQMPQVKGLAFQKPYGSDATLAILRDARSLTHLQLDECPVSEEGLKCLRDLTALTCLQLNGKTPEAPQASDAQRQLESSGPSQAEYMITDAGLEPISHLTAHHLSSHQQPADHGRGPAELCFTEESHLPLCQFFEHYGCGACPLAGTYEAAFSRSTRCKHRGAGIEAVAGQH